MMCKGFIFIVLAISAISNAVKVNIHGSLSFGKDVLKTLSNYMKHNSFNSRRSLSNASKDEESIISTVNSAALCHNLDLCQNKFGKFIVKYVIMLVKAVSTVFDRLLYESNGDDGEKAVISVSKLRIFEEKLKYSLKDIRKILKTANDKITDDNEVYIWTDVIKNICSNIQEMAILFATETVGGNQKDIHEIKKKLTQQLIIETIIVEAEFRKKLCSENNICAISYECTKALNTLMVAFRNMDNDKVKTFVRIFYEVLPDTTFYSILSEVTFNEFQLVLNDMAFSENVSTKDVLLTIQNTVENRLKSSENNYYIPKGRDVALVHIILSDMDHIYSKNKAEPFYGHLSGFFYWSAGDGRLNSIMHQIMKDISKQISSQSDDLIVKLINEVRVFLELTVDPEK